MIKPDETSGSFSSSGASDTFPENNEHRESLSTLFSNLFTDTETGSRDLKGRRVIASVTGRSVADIAGIVKKKNSSNGGGSTKNKILLSDTQRTSSVFENGDTCGEEEIALSPLRNDAAATAAATAAASDRSKPAPPLSCSSRVPVPVVPVPVPVPIPLPRTLPLSVPFPVSISTPIPTLYTSDDVNSSEKVTVPGETASGLGDKQKGVETSSTLRRIRSSASRIPVSITRRVNSQSQRRNHFFLSTRGCFQRALIHESGEPSQHKRSGSVVTVTSNKYDHIKSKVAAYIYRPTKHESAAAAAAANKINTTRSMSPNDSRMRNDAYASGDGMRRLMSSRTSLETYTCENKMPSADISIDLGKFENAADSDQKIRKHIELALEHYRRKLEQERIIAGHHRDIAKQHQLVLEHGERAHDCLQKAMLLLLDKK